MTVWFVERPVAEMKPPRFTQAHPGETPLNRIPDRASSNVTPGVTNPGIAGRGDHNSAALEALLLLQMSLNILPLTPHRMQFLLRHQLQLISQMR